MSKQKVKMISSEFEEEIRTIVRDELKKSSKSDANKLFVEINKIVAEVITNHILSISEFVTKKLSKNKQ